jgi:hypothetical protein
MFRNVTLLILFITVLSGCKKEDQSTTSSTGSFIEINGDKRIIDATNKNVTFEYGTWGDPGWQFTITDNQFSNSIAGISNTGLKNIITIWDNNLAKANYSIVDFSENQPTGFAQAYMELYKQNGAILNKLRSKATSGNVKYSVVNSSKVVEFSGIKLFDSAGTLYTVSGRMEFSGSPHNTHW